MDFNIWDDNASWCDYWTGDPIEALAYYDAAQRMRPNLVLHITRYETYEDSDGYMRTNTDHWTRLTRDALKRLAETYC